LKGAARVPAAATSPQNYIAAQFALYGLKRPAMTAPICQSVDFTGVLTQQARRFRYRPSHGSPLDLKLGDDYVTNNQTQTTASTSMAPVVFRRIRNRGAGIPVERLQRRGRQGQGGAGDRQ